jgi:hypothetical protein
MDAGATTQVDRAPVTLLRDGLREGRFEDLHTVVGLLSPRELGAQLRELPVAGPGTAALHAAARIDWLLAHGADPDVREGADDNAMFALLAQGPVAAAALQALLRRAVSPAGAGGFARFLGACVAERSRRPRVGAARDRPAGSRRRSLCALACRRSAARARGAPGLAALWSNGSCRMASTSTRATRTA